MKITKIFLLATLLPFVLSAQNFTNGFNFNLPHNDTTPSVFLPNFPKKTITEADRVSVQGENFMVNGKPHRFWGVNLTTFACFPVKEFAPRTASRMRKMGINLVRFHHMDNPWTTQEGTIFTRGQSTRTLNTTSLDRFDYLISELKKNNIYSNINLNVGRTFSTLDGVAGADSLIDFGKGVTIFDPQIITLQKEYAKQLLTHINPYTNLSLANDPSVAMVEMINENSLYGMWKDNGFRHIKDGGNLLQRHITYLDSAWNDFVAKKYPTQTALQAAWANTSGTTPIERVQNGNFESTTLGANWQNETHNGAAATFTMDNTQKASGTQSAKVNITNATGTDWHIQFKYVNFSFKKDSNYILKFTAKADRNRVMGVSLLRNDAPYTWYGGQTFNLTTEWQTFQFSVTPSEDINGVGRISFGLGQSTGSVWFDNVSFSEPIIQTIDASESVTTKNIRRIRYDEKGIYAKQRVADLAAFYIGLQKGFMEDMRLYLKNELGVKAPITGTNALVGIQEGLQHEQMDYIDDHNYWDHPWFPGTPWDGNNWLMSNKSLLKEPNGGALVGALSGIGLADKPFTVSEYNQPFPNRYRVEMVHEWAAYGSFHGMDGLMFFEYSGDAEATAAKDFIPSYFNTARDPAVMAQFPTCAYAYRNGLIANAKQPILVNYSRKDIYNSFEKDNQGRWGKYVPYPLQTQLTHSVRTKSYNSATDYTPSVLPPMLTAIFETDTKETLLNTTKGVLTTNTPKFVAITGFLNDATNTTAGNLTLLSGNEFGSLTWVSFGTKALTDADTSLITLSSRAQNVGMVWNAANTSINNNWGTATTQMQPLDVSLKLNINAESIDIQTLTPTGQVQSVKNIRPISKGIFDIRLSQTADKTVWYALVLKKTTGLKEAQGFGDMEVSPNPARDGFQLSFHITTPTQTTISLVDMAGRVVFTKPVRYDSAGKKQEWLDVRSVAKGTYIVRIGDLVRKVVIK
jgi:hypothetical protein